MIGFLKLGMGAGKEDLALADSAAKESSLACHRLHRLGIGDIDCPPDVFAQNNHIGILHALAGNSRRAARINDGSAGLRPLKHLLAFICQCNLDRRLAAIMPRIVTLERHKPQAWVALARLLKRKKRSGAYAIILASIENKAPESFSSVLSHSLVLACATAARLNHKIKAVKPAFGIFLRRKDLKLEFRSKCEHPGDDDV